MADDGKVKIAIDLKLNPFGECKGAKAPDWFAARPKLMAKVKEIQIKESMELNPKWKKKVIEKGIYAVARYELARFATALDSMQKDIDKAIPPKERKNKKFTSDTKKESKEESTALSNAEQKVTKVWGKISGLIQTKVADALEEIESDKGDNKKAIARGKAALAKFKGLKIDGTYETISKVVQKSLMDLALELKKDPENAKAWDEAEKDLNDCKSEFEGDTKTAQDVVKFLLTTGTDMKKNKDAAPAMQAVGKTILSKKTSLDNLSNTVDAFEKELAGITAVIKDKKKTADQIASAGRTFYKDNSVKDKITKATFKDVDAISDQYLAAVKSVK